MFLDYFSEIGRWIIVNLNVINMILAIVIIFFQRREPRSVWTWLLVLYALPIVGFILYLMIGQDMHKSKMFKLKEMEDELEAVIKAQEDSIARRKYKDGPEELGDYESLIIYNMESSNSLLTKNNDIKIITDGKEKFSKLQEDIKAARKFIHIQYYIIRMDELFDHLKDMLLEKVKEGVEVRILYDSMGCKSVPKKYFKNLQRQGIQMAEFFPAFLGRLQLRINYRNHRKIVVVDGETAYIGGFNVGREYLGLDEKFGYWRDTHLRIQGSAVPELQTRFILDWDYAAKENLIAQKMYYPKPSIPFSGESQIQVISSGPDSTYHNIRNNFLRLIHSAKKNIYIQTPYFIPDESIMDALKMAAVAGIDIRIMIPCKPDHPFVYWATYAYIGEMIRAGGRCYTYNNGFLHAKGMIVDGKVMCFGTANMDIRSFKLNFEVNVMVYDKEISKKMEQIFIKDLKKCSEITSYVYARRKIIVRVKEQFCRLLSPLM